MVNNTLVQVGLFLFLLLTLIIVLILQYNTQQKIKNLKKSVNNNLSLDDSNIKEILNKMNSNYRKLENENTNLENRQNVINSKINNVEKYTINSNDNNLHPAERLLKDNKNPLGHGSFQKLPNL